MVNENLLMIKFYCRFCFPTQSSVITGLSEQSGKLILAFDDGFINVIDDYAHRIRLEKSSFFICQVSSPLKFERSNENILHGFGFIIFIFFIYVILSLIIIATKKKQSKQTSKKAIRRKAKIANKKFSKRYSNSSISTTTVARCER